MTINNETVSLIKLDPTVVVVIMTVRYIQELYAENFQHIDDIKVCLVDRM